MSARAGSAARSRSAAAARVRGGRSAARRRARAAAASRLRRDLAARFVRAARRGGGGGRLLAGAAVEIARRRAARARRSRASRPPASRSAASARRAPRAPPRAPAASSDLGPGLRGVSARAASSAAVSVGAGDALAVELLVERRTGDRLAPVRRLRGRERGAGGLELAASRPRGRAARRRGRCRAPPGGARVRPRARRRPGARSPARRARARAPRRSRPARARARRAARACPRAPPAPRASSRSAVSRAWQRLQAPLELGAAELEHLDGLERLAGRAAWPRSAISARRARRSAITARSMTSPPGSCSGSGAARRRLGRRRIEAARGSGQARAGAALPGQPELVGGRAPSSAAGTR